MTLRNVPVGVLTATSFEARTLERLLNRREDSAAGGTALLSGISGIGAENAARCAQGLLEKGAGALASWGVAGALDPDLAAGDVLLPETIRLGGGRVFEVDARWQGAVGDRLRSVVPVHTGALLHVEEMVSSADAKRALRDDGGAAAIDMESGAVAAAAREAGVPFVVIRVICDQAGDDLPAAAADLLYEDASPDAGRFARAMLARPAEWGSWVTLCRRGMRACRRLRELAGALGPGLAFDQGDCAPSAAMREGMDR
jgi:adenosylhomocysteine nucleosidase